MLTPRSARDRFNLKIKAVNRVDEHSPHPNTRQVQTNGRNIRHRSLPGAASLVTHRSQQGLTPNPRTDENLRDCFNGLDAGRLRELQQVRMPMPGRITYGEHTAPDCLFPLGRRGDRPKAGGRLIGSVVAVVMVLLASGVPAAAQAGGYPDVEGGVHARSIAALASDGRGILAGTDCDGGLFCPDDPLLRWVMAVWLVRAVDGADPDPSGVSSFTDVSPVRWWAPYTNRLADLEVTRGCSEDPPRYCPDQSVTRAQMASFLARAFELPGGGARSVLRHCQQPARGEHRQARRGRDHRRMRSGALLSRPAGDPGPDGDVPGSCSEARSASRRHVAGRRLPPCLLHGRPRLRGQLWIREPDMDGGAARRQGGHRIVQQSWWCSSYILTGRQVGRLRGKR